MTGAETLKFVNGHTYDITGATDAVLGNDGSPFSNTNGKEPFKLQGIEVMLGMYEVPVDTIVVGNGVDAYDVFTCRHAASLASGSAEAGAVNIGTIPNASAAPEWKYTAELNWQNNQEAYMLQKQDSGVFRRMGEKPIHEIHQRQNEAERGENGRTSRRADIH